MPKKIAVIGSGFSSLSAACYLAHAGHEVHVFEKNATLGGRARQLQKDGFTFDMGPSWYWMPDIFEKFFNNFGKNVSDYYQLEKLDPAYKVWFADDIVTIGDTLDKIAVEFERIEPGSSAALEKFIKKAGVNYDIAINDIVNKPGISPLELVTPQTALRVNQFFRTISDDVRKAFKNKKLVSILEFPVLFLGAKPNKTPAFYRFMNYADFGLGTWHPKGGMHSVIKGMITLAEELGVHLHTNADVEQIIVDKGIAKGLLISGKTIPADIVVSGADYHHSETLLSKEYRQYSEKYWDSRVFAPSSLLFYVGFDKKFKNLAHHNLFFDTDFDEHARTIYDDLAWPEEPLFYANFPSVNDSSMAPDGKENGFFLIPIAPGVEDNQQLRDKYFDIIMKRITKLSGEDFKSHILFKESFCVKDFISEYNSYKGNAYGMANTLKQTAFLRPNLKSKKVKNLYFTGQLTVPGPGVPPALISGKLTAQLINKIF
ncbi:phytoene desaturase family protein [Dokdonia sp. Hel_I_53]|uniref:phytoene desaturase family protein n=1 Tax=Dokdonia sp. Hel_I_53 TaxID=1566287 RepID=UPI00119A8FA0|nr:phytoene desaturase family protein [Dokdonia sp. Hel_I_53]TVZ51932.1 phytoene desaturase [Dokdonia sp. Hel_I_53]